MPTTSANIPKTSAPTPTGNVGKVYGTYTTESEKKAAASNDWLLPKDRKAEDAKIAASKASSTTPVKKVSAPEPQKATTKAVAPTSGSSASAPVTGSMVRPDGLEGIVGDIKKPDFSQVTMPNIGNIIKKPSLPGIGAIAGLAGGIGIASLIGGGSITEVAKGIVTDKLQTKAQDLLTSKLPTTPSLPKIDIGSKVTSTLSSFKG